MVGDLETKGFMLKRVNLSKSHATGLNLATQVSQVNVLTPCESVRLPCFDQCRKTAVRAKSFKSCPGFTPHLQFQKELNPHSLGLVTDCPHNIRCSYIAVRHPCCCPDKTVGTFRKHQHQNKQRKP